VIKFKFHRNLSEKYFHAIRSVERDHIIAGSGCGSVIDLLVSTLCGELRFTSFPGTRRSTYSASLPDEGDGILVGKPYYNGFAASFECRSGVVPVGVTLPTGLEAEESCIEYFEEALKESELKGIKIRAVMLCNPHNPLGFCYSKETIKCYMRFAEQYQIHFISDEIYALSTYESASMCIFSSWT
jgi:1-aminocyclopropane-1-carboxylate synthase